MEQQTARKEQMVKKAKSKQLYTIGIMLMICLVIKMSTENFSSERWVISSRFRSNESVLVLSCALQSNRQSFGRILGRHKQPTYRWNRHIWRLWSRKFKVLKKVLLLLLTISPSNFICNLGIVFDPQLTVSQHVTNVCKSVNWQISNLTRIRYF